jgi:hypothetical protein
VPGLAADRQPPPPRARPARLRRALQHAEAAPRARPPATATSRAAADSDTDRRGGPSPRPPRRPHPRVLPNRRLRCDTTNGALHGMLRGSLRHLTARVPESADIQPHLCWRRERQKVARAGISPPAAPTSAWEPQRRSHARRKPCKSATSYQRAGPIRRCTGGHAIRTNALQTARIMELGGLEPPTSWVRSSDSPCEIGARRC